MSARVKIVKAAPAQNVANRENDLIVLKVLKRRPVWLDGNRKVSLRRIIVERANKDLERQPEAVSEHNEINEGIISARDKTD